MEKKYYILGLSVLFIFSSGYEVLSKDKTVTINNNNLYSDESMVKEAYNAFNQKRYDKSAFLYGKLAKKFPDNDGYIIGVAHSLFMNKNYKEAYQKYAFLVSNSSNANYVSQAKSKIKEIQSIFKSNQEKNLSDKIVVVQKEQEKEEDNRKVVSITEDEKDNYLCNKKDPSIFYDSYETFRRWEKEDLPIKVYIPLPPNSYKLDNPEKYIQWTKTSLQRWANKIPSLVKYVYVDSADKANIVVNWNNYFTDDAWGMAQLPHYESKLKKRVSNINLAVRAKLSNAEVFFSETEFIQVATHEAGHALGLSHSYKGYGNDDIMYPSYRSMIPGSEPDITQRDINSLVKLYSLKRENRYKCN